MLRLAFRNLFRHRARTGLTLAVILFGVMAVILTGGFVEDIFVQLREVTIHSRHGHIQIYRAGYQEHLRKDPFGHMIEDLEGLRAQVAQVDGVKDVLGRIDLAGLVNNGRADLPVLGEGVEPAGEARLGTFLRIVAGRQMEPADAYGILLGEGVASALNLAAGDYVTLLANTLEGSLNSLELEVVGVFRTFSKDYDDRAVRLPLSAAQELLGTAAVHKAVVVLESTERTEPVAAELVGALPAGAYELKTWEDLDDFYRKTVAFYRREFAVFQLITLLMVVVSDANSVNMTVHERVGELGTLQALGSRPRDVVGLLMTEHALLAGIGAGIGVVLGIASALLISELGIPMPPPPNSNSGYTAYIRVVPLVVAVAFVLGLAATLISALLAARRVTKVPIVDALRQNV